MPRKSNRLEEPLRINLRKDDVVIVTTGKDKGKEGRILSVDRWTGRVLVEGVNLVKRHVKPNPAKQIKGGIAEREATIHVSNVMIKGADGKPVRIKHKVEQAGDKLRRTRVDGKTGAPLDRK